MKWSNKIHKKGEERILSKFLWLPMTLNEVTYWLVTKKIKQVYVTYLSLNSGIWVERWSDRGWVEE